MPGFNRLLKNTVLSAGLVCTAMLVCACGSNPSLIAGSTIVPQSQDIFLNVDADKDDYSGRVAIKLDVRRATRAITFHALEMDLKAVMLAGDGDTVKLDCATGPKGVVTALAPEMLKPGSYTLRIAFENKFNRKGAALYKTEHDGESYLFTQFEPEFARKAFPCFDAPEFKIRWRMTLTAPKGHMLVSNTPPEKTDISGPSKTVRFARTRPMPSYLLALAAGPLEAIEVRGMSVPGRIITARGQKHLAWTARNISPKLLKTLEEYFECPYPYAKLDQIAVPEFNFGAMENVGAITYRDSILLKDPRNASVDSLRGQALIIAHEMAHMWFGNLVTPKWWDDLWLNESFASWIALKTVEKAHPEFAQAGSDITSRERAMGFDSAPSTRAIRRKVAVDEDMMRLFNPLPYHKGMSVLTMVEDWLGPDLFRAGMVGYMTEHRWGNADAFDLSAALAKVDDSNVNAIMKDFVTLPGVPLVKVEFTAEDKVRLTQSRYNLFGRTSRSSRPWTIPVMLRYSDGEKDYTHRVLLSERTQIVKLHVPILRKPKGWIYPNADEKGYYRWAMERGELRRLTHFVQTEFGARRRIGFLGNAEALFYAGQIPAGEFMSIVSSFNLDASSEVVAKVVELLSRLHDDFVTEEMADSYAAYLRSVLGPSLRKIGVVWSVDESANAASLRADLISLLGEKGRDPDVLALAGKQADRYLSDPSLVDANLAETFLRLSAMNGDSDLFDTYADQFENANDPTRRTHYLEALSNFRDPKLMDKALDYAMNGPVKPNRVYKIIFEWARGETSRRKLFDWVVANYDAIKKRVPQQALPYYPWIADGHSPKLLEDMRAFFGASKNRTDSMAEEIRKVSDSVNLRVRLNARYHDDIVKFLDRFAKRDDKDAD
jgi:cytosol alanyl aminopeptidase